MQRWLWAVLISASIAVPRAWADDEGSQITIYNQNFADVTEKRTLELRRGDSEVRITGLTSQLEPDSVILRGLHGEGIRILEQNYEADPLSEAAMLRASEGKTIDFEITSPNGARSLVKGRIIRSESSTPAQEYPYAYRVGGNGSPIVEVDGKLQFGLPGKPLFDAIQEGAFLQPTLLWKLHTDWDGRQGVELSYLTSGFSWEATYDAVTQGTDGRYDIIGWITLKNESGKDFQNANVKLVAGDVARVEPEGARERYAYAQGAMMAKMRGPEVTEKAFDEYHLYSLPRPTTLLDRETKQVEFLRASHVPLKRLYVVESTTATPPQQNYGRSTGQAPDKVPVNTVLEVKNERGDGLGMPLPGGTVKVYRTDDDGHNEFIGEARIDHTPKDEKFRIVLGSAFDLVAERRTTNAEVHVRTADVSYEIKLRNHKQENVVVSVVEHPYAPIEWAVTDSSIPFEKVDAATIRFDAPVPAGGETSVTYTVHYAW